MGNPFLSGVHRLYLVCSIVVQALGVGGGGDGGSSAWAAWCGGGGRGERCFRCPAARCSSHAWQRRLHQRPPLNGSRGVAFVDAQCSRQALTGQLVGCSVAPAGPSLRCRPDPALVPGKRAPWPGGPKASRREALLLPHSLPSQISPALTRDLAPPACLGVAVTQPSSPGKAGVRESPSVERTVVDSD